LLDQGYQVTIGREGEDPMLITPLGARRKKFDYITMQGSRRYAGELTSVILDYLQAELTAEIQADRKRQRKQMGASLKRTGQRRRHGDDPLSLKGRLHTMLSGRIDK
jgi:hypothetical protein